MKAIIVIECDEDNEVIQHLSEVRKQLKSAILKRRKTPDDLTDIVVSDNNCYGSHMATVECGEFDTSHGLLKDYTL